MGKWIQSPWDGKSLDTCSEKPSPAWPEHPGDGTPSTKEHGRRSPRAQTSQPNSLGQPCSPENKYKKREILRANDSGHQKTTKTNRRWRLTSQREGEPPWESHSPFLSPSRNCGSQSRGQHTTERPAGDSCSPAVLQRQRLALEAAKRGEMYRDPRDISLQHSACSFPSTPRLHKNHGKKPRAKKTAVEGLKSEQRLQQ